MGIKLFDSELKVMEMLWQHGDLTAKQLSDMLEEQTGWNINTTYTVIKKCIKKGAIERYEPNFTCKALITKEQAQEQEVSELVDKIFDGSIDKLFVSIMNRENIPEDVIAKVQQIIEEEKRGDDD